MATVQLGRNECENGKLPPVCMCCGAGAEEFVSKQFVWHPSLVWTIVSFGVFCVLLQCLLTDLGLVALATFVSVCALALIVAESFNRGMIVRAPLCSLHRRHWSNRRLFNFYFLILLLSTAFSLIIVSVSNALPMEMRFEVGGMICIGLTFAGPAWAVAAVVWDFRLIRPQHIDEKSITLSGVAPGFVAAVKQMEQDRTG
jgi:hypothetical protein